jgi:hypothetical protein
MQLSPKSPVKAPPDPNDPAVQEWLIKTQPRAFGVNILSRQVLALGVLIGQIPFGAVARHHFHQREDKERDQQKRDHRQNGACCDKAQKVGHSCPPVCQDQAHDFNAWSKPSLSRAVPAVS